VNAKVTQAQVSAPSAKLRTASVANSQFEKTKPICGRKRLSPYSEMDYETKFRRSPRENKAKQSQFAGLPCSGSLRRDERPDEWPETRSPKPETGGLETALFEKTKPMPK
jgi:hypothetical protein